MFLPRIEKIRKCGLCSYIVFIKGFIGEFIVTMNTDCEWRIL